jgi:hypothetical protein
MLVIPLAKSEIEEPQQLSIVDRIINRAESTPLTAQQFAFVDTKQQTVIAAVDEFVYLQ